MHETHIRMDAAFLNEILASEGSHLPNISSKILELMTLTNTLKNDVRAVVEYGSIQFNPLLNENEKLKIRANNLLEKMTEVQTQIDSEIKSELTSCVDELENLSASLKEVNLFLEILKQILKINELIQKAKEKMENKEFYECSGLVTQVKELVKCNSDKLKQVEIFKLLSQEVVLTYEQLIHQISEIWIQSVNINCNSDSKNTEVKIVVDTQSYSDINQVLKASALLKLNLVRKKFSKTLLNEVLKNIILKKSNITIKSEEKAILIIELFESNKKPNYLEVFKSIKTVIEFLKSNLDVEIQCGINFLSEVGSHIAADFADCLIKNCLSETIPSSSNDLDKYKDVVENAGELEKTLQETGFLPSNYSSLLDYAKNINVLFANKCCQSYLQKARMIVKKDLHNVTTCKEITSNVNVLPTIHRNILKEKMNIHDEVFSFQKCQISKQAEEVMVLIQSMMNEIQKSKDLCAVRLFYTVRNIFEMYAAVVPLHHQKFLETLPHQVALFHNNCMYFAHNLINLATAYYDKIPSVLKDHYMTLLEEAVVLRSLAVETLQGTVTNQRNQLVYILRDSGFAILNENPKLDLNSEKSIRQCMRQLQILQNVWVDVLPLNVYNRAIGFLLDAIVDELINLIIVVEDISSQTASELESCFKIILDKAPNLFPESKEIHRHVKKWQKFKEFVLVIQGSLVDIGDRWANGMGPLALEFTPDQVKHLIRALFQNSDRRAALLAVIK